LCLRIAHANYFAIRPRRRCSRHRNSVPDSHRARVPHNRLPRRTARNILPVQECLLCSVRCVAVRQHAKLEELWHSPDARLVRRSARDIRMKCNNILEAVGHTPLIRLNRINQGLKPQMYVKAEFTNPGGSVKDRIGITMIDEAEKKRPAQAQRHDYRRHFRQYRHGAGAGRGRARIQMRFHHHR
jgi:hypothetical protein